MIAVALCLVAAASWGAADFVAGLTSRRLPALTVLLVQQAVGAALVAVVIVAAGDGPPGARAAILSILAGATGAVALAAFYRGLAIGTMSVVAPIAATGIALPVAVGIATGDRPSAVQAAGLALAVAGVLLASREGEAAGSAARQAVLLALGAALGFGLYFVLADVAADDSVLWLLVLARATAVLLLGVAALAGRGFVAPPRDALGTLTLVGLLDVGATGLYALANRTGDLSVVAVVGSLYPVATILLARVVLRERLRPAQAAGVGLAFAGVAAIAGG